MPDPERVRRTMSRVRSSGSKIERMLGKALWKAGFRYRKQYPVFGKPDFVLVKARIAIFCDSEFWHGYRWGERRKAEHKSNQVYWFAKIEKNRARDRAVRRRLESEGWCVLRFWERQIVSDSEACVAIVRLAYVNRGRLRELTDSPAEKRLKSLRARCSRCPP